MAQLALALLGPLRATLDGIGVAGFESQKVRALLAYLALEAARPHSRDALAGLLWPEQPDHDARNNLRQALANLRQALGDQRATPPFLLIAGATIQFNRASDHRIDVAAFSESLDACDRHPHRHPDTCTSCARRLHQAAEQYHGDFLDQFFLSDSAAFEEWALLVRERLHRRAIAALDQLADYHERRGDDAQAQQYAQRLLELDPWREASHRQLMRLLARGGQRSAALVQYATCRRVLAAELGVEPETETAKLYERIQRGEALADARPLPATNLAAHTPPTPLIGRENELAQIADRLEQRDCRLLTLVGPGGVGKTRLALHAASDLYASFSDGIYFVPLAPVSSAELIVPVIAGALGFIFHGPADPKTQLLVYLREKDMLLLLDNFEQLLSGADMLSDILQAASGVVLLVTSREPLHLRVEWLLDIDGLPVPERADDPGIERSSAVRLFVQTASRMRLKFALSAETVPSVVHICQMLAGMPLAIELAAAWVRSRSCSEIAQGLEQSLEQLTTTMWDVPARHSGMRAVFDHSWRLLTAAEQGVLRRLSVFRGGMEADAAACVAGATPSLLAALVDKSLLRRNGMGRYELHELVREYADEQLTESGEAECTKSQHAAYLLALAERVGVAFSGSEPVVWLGQMDAEYANLRAALRWTAERGAIETGVRLAASWWWERGHGIEARMWLETFLQQRNNLPVARQAQALRQAGNLATIQGDYPGARVLLEESLALARVLGDKQGIAIALDRLGFTATAQGHYRQALELLEQSGALFQELGDTVAVAVTLLRLGAMLTLQGDHARAMALYQESLALAQEQGDTLLVGWAFYYLGSLAQRQGDARQARTLLAKSLPAFQEYGDLTGIISYLEGMAEVAGIEGQPERLVRLFGAAAPLHARHGMSSYPAEQAEYEHQLLAACAQLGKGAYDAAWAAGRAMPLDQAIVEALQTAG